MDLITTTVLDILDEPQQRIRTGCAALSGGERMSEATAGGTKYSRNPT